jgi:crotonobetainyl-CoA:carnitine CoA-transferase CaiB-like acyl-CoA transferase
MVGTAGVAFQLLADTNVLDLTHYIAGPYCTRMLAGLGANVLKVERPGTGDSARHLPPFYDDRPGLERSGTFLWLNMGKKSLTLDLKSSTGLDTLLRLVTWADVLVENFAPRVLPLQARGFFEICDHPQAGTHAYYGRPMQLSKTPLGTYRPAPCFGEHHAYVFGELLGLSTGEIETLTAEGILAERPLTPMGE